MRPGGSKGARPGVAVPCWRARDESRVLWPRRGGYEERPPDGRVLLSEEDNAALVRCPLSEIVARD